VEWVQADRNKRFGEVVMPHLDTVYRAAAALCRQGAQAEDLTQTTMLKALETLDSFAEGTNCKAWLVRILRNTWIDTLRRRKTAGTAVPLEETLVPAPESPADTKWTNARDLLENFSDEDVIETLSELPDDQRLALYLVDVELLDQREVADIMGVPVGTIKSRTSRARAILRERLRAKAKDLGFTGRVRRDSSER
jgi:RNA polymerase sigma-70 factor (ECF subfamily)